MAKYRKKPVVIEAEVYRPGLEDGFGGCDSNTCIVDTVCVGKECYLYRPYINTLEGRHYISPGDYIITGIKGEQYPCKPDIFNATYELVEEDE